MAGHNGMGGRPSGPSQADLRAAIRAATSAGDIVDIFRKAVEQGKRGNDPARRFVWSTLGLAEILIDVTSAGEKIDSLDATTIAEALAILGSANGGPGR